jgi:uncharacterized RDD family membrane protein YckC
MNDMTKESSPFAGFWIRAGAFLVDKAFLWLVIFILAQIMHPELVDTTSKEEMEKMREVYNELFIAAFLFSAAYEIILTASPLQGTLGKKAFGLIVVDKDAKRLTIIRSIIRHLGKMLSEFILGIGYLMAAFHDRKRALHDIIADTYVVKI